MLYPLSYEGGPCAVCCANCADDRILALLRLAGRRLEGVWGASWRGLGVAAAWWLWQAALVPDLWGFRLAMRLVPRWAGASLFGAAGVGRTICSDRRRCGCGRRPAP